MGRVGEVAHGWVVAEWALGRAAFVRGRRRHEGAVGGGGRRAGEEGLRPAGRGGGHSLEVLNLKGGRTWMKQAGCGREETRIRVGGLWQAEQ